jgi:hypothetical protein
MKIGPKEDDIGLLQFEAWRLAEAERKDRWVSQLREEEYTSSLKKYI